MLLNNKLIYKLLQKKIQKLNLPRFVCVNQVKYSARFIWAHLNLLQQTYSQLQPHKKSSVKNKATTRITRDTDDFASVKAMQERNLSSQGMKEKKKSLMFRQTSMLFPFLQ